jgi:hypothetical protein
MEVFLREVKELVEKMARDLLDGKPAIHCVETLRSQSLTTFTELGQRATEV